MPADCAHRQPRNTPVAPTRKLSATTFIRRSPRSRSASACGSAPANDSAKDAGLPDSPFGNGTRSVRAARKPRGSARCLGPGLVRSATTPIIRHPRDCSATMRAVRGPRRSRTMRTSGDNARRSRPEEEPDHANEWRQCAPFAARGGAGTCERVATMRAARGAYRLPREPDNGNESATKRERLLLPARQLSAVIRAVGRESVVDNPYYYEHLVNGNRR